jgi:hypothetical protein
MIRDRNANACEDFARRDHRTSWSRSPSVNTNSAFGRPRVAMHRIMLHSNTIRSKPAPQLKDTLR